MNLDIENSNEKLFDSSFSNDLKQHLEKVNTTFSIDRFEENFAICENLKTGEFVNIPIELLPENCKEGSILKFENNKYILDTTQTENAQKEISDLVNNLFKRKK